jgi:RNA polymerase sigma-70 factor (ECF subfamily)
MNLRASLARRKTSDVAFHDGDAISAHISLCRSGDQKAWEHLVELFYEVYCNLHSYDSQKGPFHIWLQNVTRNYLVDHYRRTRVVRLSSSLEELLSTTQSGSTVADLLTDRQPSQEDRLIALESRARVHNAVESLSPIARDTVRLCLLDEHNHKEAANLLGVAEGTIKSRLSRARVELTQLLSPLHLAKT